MRRPPPRWTKDPRREHRRRTSCRPRRSRPPGAARAAPVAAGRGAALWRIRGQMIRTMCRQALATARLRVSLVVVLSLVFWYGLFFLFRGGFEFLDMTIDHPLTLAQTVQAIYNVFFASLLLMLILSSAIILYGGLYCSSEAQFLLTTPVRPERIVLHKFQEAIVFSSWGFLLLGSPMLVAHGLQFDAPWYYFALLLPFMAAFVYIPGGIGAILCLLFVHHLARIRRQTLAVAVVAGIGGHAGARLVAVRRNRGEPAHRQLVSRDARPAPVQRTSPAAELVAQFGAARSGPQRRRTTGQSPLGRKPAVLVAADRQCPVFAGAGRRRRRAHLSPELQRTANRTGPTPPQPAVLAGRRGDALCALADAANAAADRQRPAAVSPRSGAVVAVHHLLRPVGTVLCQHSPLQLRRELHGLGQHDQLFEPGRGGADSLDLHHPVHLPDVEPRGPPVLDSLHVAGASATRCCGASFCSPRPARPSPAAC